MSPPTDGPRPTSKPRRGLVLGAIGAIALIAVGLATFIGLRSSGAAGPAEIEIRSWHATTCDAARVYFTDSAWKQMFGQGTCTDKGIASVAQSITIRTTTINGNRARITYVTKTPIYMGSSSAPSCIQTGTETDDLIKVAETWKIDKIVSTPNSSAFVTAHPDLCGATPSSTPSS